MAFKDNAVELEERVVAINRVTKVVKGGLYFYLVSKSQFSPLNFIVCLSTKL